MEGRAAQLRHLGRTNESLAAYTEALRVTGQEPAIHAKIRQRMFLRRAELLEQLGRNDEAKADRDCAASP